MTHIRQRDFILKVKSFFPEYFNNVNVLEVGSLHINETIRDFFINPTIYIGLDLIQGPGVDIVCPGKDFNHASIFKTVISTEYFEHDKDWKETFINMHKLTENNGLVIFTCASDGRHEHDTTRTSPQDPPSTNDYYMNLNKDHFCNNFPLEEMFEKHAFEYNPVTCDLYFWGIKKE